MSNHFEPVSADLAADAGRRRFLEGVIGAISAAIAATLAVIFGEFSLPGVRAGEGTWVPAADAGSLEFDVPKEITVSSRVKDGWLLTKERQLVYAIAHPDGSVTVLSSTCTHLGCSVAWDGKRKQFRCPCHGGVYDASGRNIAGPPPRPLRRFEARLAHSKLEIKV